MSAADSERRQRRSRQIEEQSHTEQQQRQGKNQIEQRPGAGTSLGLSDLLRDLKDPKGEKEDHPDANHDEGKSGHIRNFLPRDGKSTSLRPRHGRQENV